MVSFCGTDRATLCLCQNRWENGRILVWRCWIVTKIVRVQFLVFCGWKLALRRGTLALRRGTLALWDRRSLYEASAVPKTVRIELSRALLNRLCGGCSSRLRYAVLWRGTDYEIAVWGMLCRKPSGLNHLGCTIESSGWWSHSSRLRYAVLRRGTLALR